MQRADNTVMGLNGQWKKQRFVFHITAAKHWTDDAVQGFKAQTGKKDFCSSSRTYSTAYPRRAFAYA